MGGRKQQARHLALETILGPDVLLIESISGTDSLAKSFQYKIEASSKAEISFNELIGTKATVRLQITYGQNEQSRLFNGIFSEVSHLGFDSEGYARYELTMSPWSYFLTKTSDCRIFQELTVPEIIESVFADHTDADYILDLRNTYPTREYCVQYRETDFDFFQRLMEHEGIYYFWRHQKDKHTMVICDSMACHQPADGCETVFYSQRSSGGQADYIIEDWNNRTTVTSGSYAHNSYDFKSPTPSPNSKLLGRDDKTHPFNKGNLEIYDNPGDFIDRSDGERLAAIRLEEVQAQARTVTATTNARGLTVGAFFTPEEIPIPDQNVQHLVVSSTFSASGGKYRAGGDNGGETFEASFIALPTSDNVFRPQRTTPVPVVKGPQTAIVTGPSGEEIYVDDFGRVKVQFLWDRYGEFNDGSSCWVRVSQPWAGGKYGGLAIPRIGHEVIIDFFEGDPDRPFISGRLYNADTMPIVSNAGREANPARSSREAVKKNREERAKAKKKRLKGTSRRR